MSSYRGFTAVDRKKSRDTMILMTPPVTKNPSTAIDHLHQVAAEVRERNKNLSEKQVLELAGRCVREVIDDMVRDGSIVFEPEHKPREAVEPDETYAAMEKAKGVCKDDVSDASTTIDETLYGENGAWKGSAK